MARGRRTVDETVNIPGRNAFDAVLRQEKGWGSQVAGRFDTLCLRSYRRFNGAPHLHSISRGRRSRKGAPPVHLPSTRRQLRCPEPRRSPCSPPRVVLALSGGIRGLAPRKHNTQHAGGLPNIFARVPRARTCGAAGARRLRASTAAGARKRRTRRRASESGERSYYIIMLHSDGASIKP